MDAPFLSVLMPALNEERTISQVLDAVLASPVDLELILVDDGSTDNSAEVAVAFGAEVIRHPVNRGLAAARNTSMWRLLWSR